MIFFIYNLVYNAIRVKFSTADAFRLAEISAKANCCGVKLDVLYDLFDFIFDLYQNFSDCKLRLSIK